MSHTSLAASAITISQAVRTSVLMRHLRNEELFDIVLDDFGAVSMGGEHVGKLEGFRFAADPRAEGIHERTLRAAALKGLEGEFVTRANRLATASDSDITLSEHAQLWWAGAVVAKLGKGAHALAPTVELVADPLLKNGARELVEARLESFVAARIARVLQPLSVLRHELDALPNVARGIAFQLCEALGNLDRTAATLPTNLHAAATALAPFGVWIGRRSIYFPSLLKPQAASLAALLWAVHARAAHISTPPAPGLTSFTIDGASSSAFLAAAGFRAIAGRAVRLDILERMEAVLSQTARNNGNADDAAHTIAALLGCGMDEVLAIARALGWRRENAKNAETHALWKRLHKDKKYGKKQPVRGQEKAAPDSPFAELAALIAAK